MGGRKGPGGDARRPFCAAVVDGDQSGRREICPEELRIVDEDALYDAILSGKVAGAALDVFQDEPPGDSPLLRLDQVICTPHLGASTQEAQANVSSAVALQIIDFLKNGTR